MRRALGRRCIAIRRQRFFECWKESISMKWMARGFVRRREMLSACRVARLIRLRI